jgi:hypothetical protein
MSIVMTSILMVLPLNLLFSYKIKIKNKKTGDIVKINLEYSNTLKN